MLSLTVDDEICLKLPTLDDAQTLFDLVDHNRKFLRQHLPWVDSNTSVLDTKYFISECTQKFNEDNGVVFLIFYKNCIIGTIGLHYIDKINKKTEIGYWISESMQGKGIMRKSCKAMISYAFEKLLLHRIEIRCSINNRQSQRIPEDLGFTKEGILRDSSFLNGHFVDDIIYSLLSSDR